MRCRFCGWDNASDAGTCVKCGQVLQNGNGFGNSQFQNQRVSAPNYKPSGEPEPRPTVMGVSPAAHEPRPTVMGITPAAHEPRPTVMGVTPAAHEPRPTVMGVTPAAHEPRPTVMGVSPAAHEPRPTVMGVNPVAHEPRPTVMDTSGVRGDVNQKKLRETIAMGAVGDRKPQSDIPVSQQKGQSNIRVCPECGQPMTDDGTNCLFCGAYVGGNPRRRHNVDEGGSKTEKNAGTPPVDVHVTCPNCKEKVSAKFSYCPMCGTNIKDGLMINTIDLQGQRIPTGPQCSLTIIPEEDEQDVGLTNYYYFENKPIVLNRENTEMSNRTITSKEQAIIECEDGKWYMENRSEQQSTYLEMNRRIELQNGDIVMLGDRRFKFSSEDYEQQ